MHFFYIDESGDTGRNLDDPHQPIIVLGGIRITGWGQVLYSYILPHCSRTIPK